MFGLSDNFLGSSHIANVGWTNITDNNDKNDFSFIFRSDLFKIYFKLAGSNENKNNKPLSSNELPMLACVEIFT